MSNVKELFGIFIKQNDVDWSSVIALQSCPYIKKKCIKVRKSAAEISIGVCTVAYGKNEGIMICPHRLLERRQIFTDCMHLLTLHEPGNELHLLSEVSIPGGSVDYFLVSARENKICDFVGIELQTLDTTGSLWSERAAFIKDKGLTVTEEELRKKTFGMNWKMSAKTILVQMHHKIQTFEHVNKHLVLVIQDCFRDYMSKEFNFSHIMPARLGDSFHIHTYFLHSNNNAMRLALKDRHSTDANGIALCLGLQAEAKMDLDAIIKYLEARICENTLLQLV